MSKVNSKGLTTLRQKLRKYIRDGFEDAVEVYKENPDPEGYESLEEEVVEEDSLDFQGEDQLTPKEVSLLHLFSSPTKYCSRVIEINGLCR